MRLVTILLLLVQPAFAENPAVTLHKVIHDRCVKANDTKTHECQIYAPELSRSTNAK